MKDQDRAKLDGAALRLRLQAAESKADRLARDIVQRDAVSQHMEARLNDIKSLLLVRIA